jgi:hypothetical protein
MQRITRLAISLAVVAAALGLAVVLGAGSALSAPSKATGTATAGAGTPGPRGPRGPQGPPGPSAAFATYKDGPIPVQQTPATVASLKIATPGSYVITAKGYTGGNRDGNVTCLLDAHGDSDHAQTYAALDAWFDFSLEVVHTLTAAGSVDLNCSASTSDLNVNWIKIVAIRVGQLTNTPG